jgi:superfamily II DNA or RNA helicase
MLRPQQQALKQLTKEIEAESPVENIFLFWTPGGGKSLAPVILSDLLINNKKMVWIVPRDSLKYQGESDFINDIYPVEKSIRVSDNSGDPFRGCDACITTYQAIGANPERWIKVFQYYDCMIVADEYHHLSGHGEWIKPIREMVQLSFLRVFMTGTINRGDDTRLPFTPYIDGEIDFKDTDKTRWIIYSRNQAIKDGSILPFETTLVNGSGAYIDLDGITRSFDNFSDKSDELRCAYKTDYAYSLIDLSINSWIKYKIDHPWAKMLVVAANIDIAGDYLNYINNKYDFNAAIATSQDNAECRENIKRFKIDNHRYNSLECLVTVAVAYEGLSVKPITHMAIMTLIRSVPWLDQCIGRCVRTYKGKEKGFIFAPEDPKMVSALKQISSSVIRYATAEPPEKRTKNPDATEGGEARTIEALESHAHIDFTTELNFTAPGETQSEIEHRLRKEINEKVNSVVCKESAGNRKIKERLMWMRIKQIVNAGRDENGRLIRKSLKEMTVNELKKVNEYMNNYKQCLHLIDKCDSI